MRRALVPTALTAALTLVPWIGAAQGQAMDASRTVAGGGISVPGWSGKADGTASVETAKFAKEGDAFHVTTGPAVAYWNPANTAKGDYTVKATFTEPQYMNLNSHDHPYGIVIAGNDMGTDQQTYLYCAAYGDGRFIVRGFGPAAFKMNGPGEANAAIHKAAAKSSRQRFTTRVRTPGRLPRRLPWRGCITPSRFCFPTDAWCRPVVIRTKARV